MKLTFKIELRNEILDFMLFVIVILVSHDSPPPASYTLIYHCSSLELIGCPILMINMNVWKFWQVICNDMHWLEHSKPDPNEPLSLWNYKPSGKRHSSQRIYVLEINCGTGDDFLLLA